MLLALTGSLEVVGAKCEDRVSFFESSLKAIGIYPGRKGACGSRDIP